MKHFLLITNFLVLCCASYAQNKLSYAYDDSGNRISRTIVLTTKSATRAMTDSITKSFTDVLSRKQISIYPNPVKTDITLYIQGYDASQGEYIIYDMSGKTLLSSKFNGETTVINLQQFPKGSYLMHLLLDGDVSTWKIIKE